MKIGIISDIHGNILALEKILEKFRKLEVDKIICTGDAIGLGPYPEQVVECMMQQKNVISFVKGNHEGYFINGVPKIIHNNTKKLSEEELANHKWTRCEISKESKEFIEKLPLDNLIQIDGKRIYVVHYPLNENKQYAEHIKNPTDKEIEKLFSYVDADVYVYGHTHTSFVKKINGKIYINCGSLGCPESSFKAKSGIINIINNKVEFIPLELKYDVNKVMDDIEKIGYPYNKGILKNFYGKK